MQKAQEQADMQRMKDQAKFQEEISKRKAKEDELLLEVKRERERGIMHQYNTTG